MRFGITKKTMRRTVRTTVLALAVFAATVSLESASAQGQLKQVKIAIGGTSFVDISYYPLLLASALGYWKQEGYKVDVFPISGSWEAAQQLAAGNIDFGQMAGAVIIQANAEHSIPVRTLITNFSLGWGLAVKNNGPIKTVADLKGKTIGIVSLSSGGVSLVKSFIKNNGMDPENDVTMIATGVGAQALLALQSGQVQALMYWSSALVGFQSMDSDLKILKDPTWADMPDYSLATSQQVIDQKPEMVEGVSRGVAKAMAFAAANPDCARRLVWKFYPDTKPTNVAEQTAVANDLAKISILLSDQANASRLNPDALFAGASVKAMGTYQEFLYDAGVLKAKADPKTLVIPGGTAFWSKINTFDKAAIEADAKACKY
jgi:NitT/TauT family transport system substrate-binding protein